jgi:adenylyltransferase/sulfurtransferase
MKDIDVLVDCVDNYDTRVVMARVAHQYGKPMIHGAVSDFLGTVAVFDSRKGPCYQCVYTEKPESGVIPVFGGLPGMVGTIQAVETIKLLTGIGKIQHDKILLIDMESNRIYYADIEKRKDCPICQ